MKDKLLKLLETDIEEISDLIKTEPVLSGRLIKLSNSVFFGGGRDEVLDLNSAIMRLGLKMVLDLAYTLELPKAFKKPKSFSHMDFWKHSLAVAYLSRALVLHGGGNKEELEASYLSGLMHDVGILVFDYLIPDEYEVFIKNLGDAEKGLEELELAAFGISHPELGARFVEKWWPVSKQVVSSIRRHHGPLSGSTTSSGISRYINCANQIANNHEICNGVSPHICPMSPNLLKILNLSDKELEVFVENTQEGVAEAESILMG